jgi:hypothetical protein
MDSMPPLTLLPFVATTVLLLAVAFYLSKFVAEHIDVRVVALATGQLRTFVGQIPSRCTDASGDA